MLKTATCNEGAEDKKEAEDAEAESTEVECADALVAPSVTRSRSGNVEVYVVTGWLSAEDGQRRAMDTLAGLRISAPAVAKFDLPPGKVIVSFVWISISVIFTVRAKA